MKSKLIEKINSVYSQIQASEEELNKDLKAENVDRVNTLRIGTKGLKLQELNIEFFTLMDTFLNILEGCTCDLSEEVKNYYELSLELRKPVSSSDSEEIKKVKEMINSFKGNKE